MNIYEEKLIRDVLEVARLTELPPKTDVDSFLWIEGVAKINLANGSIGYGIVKRNHDLSPVVTYINGETSSIVSITEVYPYATINKEMIKKFRANDDTEVRKKYLQSLNLPYPIDYDNATVSDLNKEVVKAALYQQVNTQ